MAEPAASAAAVHHGGLPQFDLPLWPGQMVWALLIFGLLYLLVSRVFVPGVGGAIDAREDRIAADIGAARRLRDEAQAEAAKAAEEMVQARARAQRVALDAKAAAKAAAQARQAEEDIKLGEVLATAEARIAGARSEAMSHVRAIAATTAAAMIERLTGAPASGDDVDRALAAQA